MAGFVPVTTERATHTASGAAEPTELTVYDIGDPDWSVAAGFVPEHAPGSILLAYDGSGDVVAEWGR